MVSRFLGPSPGLLLEGCVVSKGRLGRAASSDLCKSPGCDRRQTIGAKVAGRWLRGCMMVMVMEVIELVHSCLSWARNPTLLSWAVFWPAPGTLMGQSVIPRHEHRHENAQATPDLQHHVHAEDLVLSSSPTVVTVTSWSSIPSSEVHCIAHGHHQRHDRRRLAAKHQRCT